MSGKEAGTGPSKSAAFTTVDWFDKLLAGDTYTGQAQGMPTRTLAQALQRKIQFLEDHPEMLQQFYDTVDERTDTKAHRAATTKRIRQNKQVAVQWGTLKTEQWANANTTRIERHEAAKERREQALQQRTERILAIHDRKEAKRAVLSERLETMAQLRDSDFQTLQKRWFTITDVCARLAILNRRLEQFRVLQILEAERVKAASIIQRTWRGYWSRLQRRKYEEATNTIRRVVLGYSLRRKARQRRWAARVLRIFLEDIHAAGKMGRVVRSYMSRMLYCQRIIRNYIDRKNAKIAAIEAQFLRMEQRMIKSEVRAHREAEVKRRRRAQQMPKLYDPVPEDIRHRVCVLEYKSLVMRHHQRLCDYRVAARASSALADAPIPVPPKAIRALLDDESISNLVVKGRQIATAGP